MNKKKIINDPVYGFITIPSELIFDIVSEPAFQRLRRIKQLGLAEMVYPGANHTRFHHALGAMHLMMKTLDNLRTKGHHIWDIEYEAACLAILLHDIGHGPFSHALEHTLLKKVPHEYISLSIMNYLNHKFEGKLRVAIDMFKNKYHRPFFYQLISSQLDLDRLDYLSRDCYFTGVSEGTIASERIIKMMDIEDNELVVEEKGIYSIENFLNARRLMYWQVYLHKTSVAAEQMLILIIRRAQKLTEKGEDLTCVPSLHYFLRNGIEVKDLTGESLEHFMLLDDTDVWGAIKIWSTHSDKILSQLCNMLIQRKIFKIEISNDKKELNSEGTVSEIGKTKKFSAKEIQKNFVIHGEISNKAYVSTGQSIKIRMKSGKLVDIAEASDLPNIKAISKIVKKYYICYPKNLDL